MRISSFSNLHDKYHFVKCTHYKVIIFSVLLEIRVHGGGFTINYAYQ